MTFKSEINFRNLKPTVQLKEKPKVSINQFTFCNCLFPNTIKMNKMTSKSSTLEAFSSITPLFLLFGSLNKKKVEGPYHNSGSLTVLRQNRSEETIVSIQTYFINSSSTFTSPGKVLVGSKSLKATKTRSLAKNHNKLTD